MDFILDTIAIGEYEEAVSPSSEVTALLCVAKELRLSSPSLPYHKVPIADRRPIPPEQLKDAVTWIHKATATGHRVLIFCSQGTGRSPSVAVAYLCCKMSYSLDQAIEAVAARRSPVSFAPNLAVSIERVLEAYS